MCFPSLFGLFNLRLLILYFSVDLSASILSSFNCFIDLQKVLLELLDLPALGFYNLLIMLNNLRELILFMHCRLNISSQMLDFLTVVLSLILHLLHHV
jgi:hypothetical protein